MNPRTGLAALSLCGLLTHAAPAPAQTTPRFVIQGDTVLDAKTHLVWQRCSVGQHWDGNGCVGEARQMNWYDAQKLATEEWRLPTKSELERLIDEDRKRRYIAPFIDTVAFPGADPKALLYWTSSKGVSLGYGVGFSEESRKTAFNNGFTLRFFPGAVRLVKGKKPPERPWIE